VKSPHWEDVHYVQRPGKNIERKMIIEVLGALSTYTRLDRFQYIGFGSIYFVDFALIHRRLGIRRMTSVEKEDTPEAQARVTFNRPFKFVKLRFGHSNQVLPILDWRRQAIVWLDYNARLGAEVFADLETVIRQATPPFILLVTVNADPQETSKRWQRFSEAVGPDRIPPGFNSDHDLNGTGTAIAMQQVLDDEIHRRLTVRNALADPLDRLSYLQLVHFRYKDRAHMLTTGGIILPAADEHLVNGSGVMESPYASGTETAYDIIVPNLTIREMLHLDQRLSRTGTPNFAGIGLSREEAEEYRKAYRYFPAFIDVESL
jgi:hypothetical protein